MKRGLLVVFLIVACGRDRQRARVEPEPSGHDVMKTQGAPCFDKKAKPPAGAVWEKGKMTDSNERNAQFIREPCPDAGARAR